jgi:hypothetical protein
MFNVLGQESSRFPLSLILERVRSGSFLVVSIAIIEKLKSFFFKSRKRNLVKVYDNFPSMRVE